MSEHELPTSVLIGAFSLPEDILGAELPERIGAYRIERLLGRGGTGLVYLGIHEELDRAAAIKVMRRTGRSNDAPAPLVREGRLLARTEGHPAIATVYDVEAGPDGGAVLISEYVPGETLARRLARGALGVDAAIAACEIIADAVDFAHSRGVLHCDLKPGNIMLTPRGLPKVLDFGLARLVTDSGNLRGGTPGYMSPEQEAGGSLSSATDVYALGCVLFDCLAGLPDTGAAFAPVVRDIRCLAPGTPDAVRGLIGRCIAEEAASRPSAAEVVAALRDARAGRPGPRRPAAPNNLPFHLTSFVGRKAEVARVIELLGTHRLVSLSGFGGCGKTRLAITAAGKALDAFPDGVWLVELAALSDAGLVASEVARVLGVREHGGRTMMDLLAARIEHRCMLLILDNCEHVLDAVSAVAVGLLLHCPNLRILLTTREALGVPAEATLDVPTLAVPPERGDDADLLRYESVQLFVERAQSVSPGFEPRAQESPIRQICRRLDGVPLAIELAAARLRTMTAGEMATGLTDRFRLLTDGDRTALPRHRTLRAMIDWSFDLLNEEDRTLLRRLSVFRGGCTDEAADAVWRTTRQREATRASLSRLAAKSLVVRAEVEGRSRYSLLESIRDYAAERLRENEGRREQDSLCDRHARYFTDWATLANAQLTGPDQLRWLRAMTLEHDNLRGALAWLRDGGGDRTLALQLSTDLAQFWYMCGHIDEGAAWLNSTLARQVGAADDLVAQAANRVGIFAWVQGRHREALDWYERSAAAWESMGNLERVAAVRSNLAAAAADTGDTARARREHGRALDLYARVGDTVGVARVQLNLGVALLQEEQHPQAAQLFEESLEVFRREGDAHRVAAAIHNLGVAVHAQGDSTRAGLLFTESLAMRVQLKDLIGIALDTLWLAFCDDAGGRPEDAAVRLGEAEAAMASAGARLSAIDQREHQRLVARLEACLGREELDRLRSQAATRRPGGFP